MDGDKNYDFIGRYNKTKERRINMGGEDLEKFKLQQENLQNAK
jgi:hypothetical protein